MECVFVLKVLYQGWTGQCSIRRVNTMYSLAFPRSTFQLTCHMHQRATHLAYSTCALRIDWRSSISSIVDRDKSHLAGHFWSRWIERCESERKRRVCTRICELYLKNSRFTEQGKSGLSFSSWLISCCGCCCVPFILVEPCRIYLLLVNVIKPLIWPWNGLAYLIWRSESNYSNLIPLLLCVVHALY